MNRQSRDVGVDDVGERAIRNLAKTRTLKPRWLRLTFGLRSVLVIVTLAAIWLAVTTHRVALQRHAVEAVVANGGQVTFDYEWNEKTGYIAGARPRAPSWLRKLVGDDYFRTPVNVAFNGGGDPGKALPAFGGLRKCRYLSFNNYPSLTDDDLQHLGGMRHLEVLEFRFVGIQGNGLVHIGGFPELKILVLENSPLEGDGLAYLEDCPKLRMLSLWDTNLHDDALVHISKIETLEDLQLNGTKVTDAGIKYLADMGSLKKVLLAGTQVTQSGRSELQKALPNCVVGNVR